MRHIFSFTFFFHTTYNRRTSGRSLGTFEESNASPPHPPLIILIIFGEDYKSGRFSYPVFSVLFSKQHFRKYTLTTDRRSSFHVKISKHAHRPLLHTQETVSGSRCRICHGPDTGHQFYGVESCGTVIVKPKECRKWLLGISSTNCSSPLSPLPGLKNGKYSCSRGSTSLALCREVCGDKGVVV
jgi:hypothetical protein